MPFILTCFLAIALWFVPIVPVAHGIPIARQPVLLPGSLPGLGEVFAGAVPELGVENGKLSPCPSTPNCVVSQSEDDAHHIQPITYTRDRDAARELLIKVLGVVPRTEIVTQTDNYIRVKSTSRLMGFVDDAEFYFPLDKPVIHVRSAARLGKSDLGVNRRRLEQIRLALQDLGI